MIRDVLFAFGKVALTSVYSSLYPDVNRNRAQAFELAFDHGCLLPLFMAARFRLVLLESEGVLYSVHVHQKIKFTKFHQLKT